MSKYIKKAITILIIVILIIVTIISTFLIIRYFINENQIKNISEIYSNQNVQKRLNNENTTTKDELILKIDDESVLGLIKIERIGFEGLIYEGTTLDTLSRGVGHFENSPYLDGNVCLAAHNTNKFWAKLHTLQIGDKITYVSFLGTKEYTVSNVTKISETDWSLLQNTDENILTLITCVKKERDKRFCVQATEVK